MGDIQEHLQELKAIHGQIGTKDKNRLMYRKKGLIMHALVLLKAKYPPERYTRRWDKEGRWVKRQQIDPLFYMDEIEPYLGITYKSFRRYLPIYYDEAMRDGIVSGLTMDKATQGKKRSIQPITPEGEGEGASSLTLTDSEASAMLCCTRLPFMASTDTAGKATLLEAIRDILPEDEEDNESVGSEDTVPPPSVKTVDLTFVNHVPHLREEADEHIKRLEEIINTAEAEFYVRRRGLTENDDNMPCHAV